MPGGRRVALPAHEEEPLNSEPQELAPVHLGPPIREAELVVYAVHGRGQSPDFMAEIASQISLSGVAWVLPTAPERSWYPQGFMEPLADSHVNLERSLNTVRDHTRTLLAQSDAPVAVFGFSQGACLLSEYLLRDRPPLAGAILHTGGYLGNRPRQWSPAPALDGLEVQMLTAAEDAWVPLQRVEETKAAFEAVDASVVLTVFDDPEHHINHESVQRIRKYLEALRAGKPSED
ncbi:phospholipase (plasmid) [Citricoccus nitrophenolicus]